MTYRDIWIENPSFWKRCTASYKCLAWSANYEHAVFDLDDAIHPAAVYVWIKPLGTPFILCYEKKDYCKVYDPESGWVYHEYESPRWVFVELKGGNIPLVNHNPFDPSQQNAASNTAASVFPQNQKEGI